MRFETETNQGFTESLRRYWILRILLRCSHALYNVRDLISSGAIRQDAVPALWGVERQ